MKIEIKDGTFTEAREQFLTEFRTQITTETNTIITNGNIASLLNSLSGYDLGEDYIKNEMKSEDGKPKLYNLGKFDHIQIVVDPYMRWYETKIILKNNETIINEIDLVDDNSILV